MREVLGSTPIFSTPDNQVFTKNREAFFISGNTEVTHIGIYNCVQNELFVELLINNTSIRTRITVHNVPLFKFCFHT
jgi:hypothetical protein